MKRTELMDMINDLALATMDRPTVEYRHADGTMMNLTELNAKNTNTAFYNKGIQDFADRLIEELANNDSECYPPDEEGHAEREGMLHGHENERG